MRGIDREGSGTGRTEKGRKIQIEIGEEKG